jgi:hypothetical protein
MRRLGAVGGLDLAGKQNGGGGADAVAASKRHGGIGAVRRGRNLALNTKMIGLILLKEDES